MGTFLRSISLRTLWGVALLLRLALFFVPPTLSDDIYRYDWEGRVQRAGFNPYNHPPSDPQLTFLRDANYEHINHKDIPAIYPPLTQLVFRIGSYMGGISGQKISFIAFDILAMLILSLLIKHRGLPSYRLAFYAWNPLILLEFAGSGHNDALGICCLLGGLYLWEKGKTRFGAAGLGFSFLAKFTPFLLLPYLIWKKRWKELALFVVVILAGFAIVGKLQGLRTYASHWEYNGSLFVLLKTILGNGDLARTWSYGLIALVAMWIGKTQKEMFRAAYLVIATALLLAPTVYPWYVTWLVPFLSFYPNRAFLVWNGTIFLSYSVMRHPLIPWLEYLPVYGLLIYEYRRYYSRTQ